MQSMKAVLPALTGRGYGDLAIQEGNTASLEFLRVTYGEVSEEERQRVRRQLEDYCGRDTEGMVWIVGTLRQLVGRKPRSLWPALKRAPSAASL